MIRRRQAAATPYRLDHKGDVEVLLVTSRKRGRWVLPKGNIERFGRPHRCAAREAFEEAGVLGEIEPLPTTKYRQLKGSGSEGPIEVVVDAFPLQVNAELRAWPEKAARQRRWMSIPAAMLAVQDVELRFAIHSFARRFDRSI